jgi:hypothetical protein
MTSLKLGTEKELYIETGQRWDESIRIPMDRSYCRSLLLE